MARKSYNDRKNEKAAPKAKTVMEDNFVAPKRKPKAEPTVTLAEALAEQAAEEGKTVEEVKAELTAPAADAPKPERAPGTSNLATTIRNHRSHYAVALHPNGKKTQNNGDPVARMLLAVPFEALVAFSATRFGKTYEQLNPGHARMCIGNLIRGALKKEEGPAIMEWLEAQQPKQEEGA